MREPQEDFWPYEKLPEPHPAIERGDFEAALAAFATREMLDIGSTVLPTATFGFVGSALHFG